jgi:AcrR family transcriptional regulator
MGLRESRKQATRARVLAAARDLFEEVGYEAATIRVIATRAGVATGSVFTTFDSKKAILQAVMAERLDVLYDQLSRITPHLRGTCSDRIRSIMAVHYNFEMERPRLYTAYVAISFDWTIARSPASFGGNPKLRDMLKEVLRDGVGRGEVRADLDLELFLDAMLANYGFNYRYAGDEDAVALTARLDRQIDLLFEGAST